MATTADIPRLEMLQVADMVAREKGIEREEVRLDVRRSVVDLAKLIGPVQLTGHMIVVEDADADDARREIELRLPGRYAVSPQIASALRAVKGVEQVELV